MNDDSDLESLIAAMARGEPLDWEAAFRRATLPSDRARLKALASIHRIAAFSHEQWQNSTAEPATAGQMVGAYELESLIGSGGMGAVWRGPRPDCRHAVLATIPEYESDHALDDRPGRRVPQVV